MKLSENIEFIYKVGIPPARSVLGSWQEMARELEDRAENLDDKLRATKAELESCRAAIKGKNERIQGLNDQLRERDQIIVALRQEGEHLRRSISENANTVALNNRIAQLESRSRGLEAAWQAAENRANFNKRSCEQLVSANKALNKQIIDLKRDASENANTVALNKHIAKLTSESQSRLDENRRLEATIKDLKRVLTESEMRASLAGQQARDAIADCAALKRALAAKTLDCNDAANKLAEKTQQYNTLMMLHENQMRTIVRYQRQTDELIGERNELKEKLGSLQRHNTSMGNTVSEVIDERNRLQRNLEIVTLRSDKQAGYIREFQEEVRKLREQLETEKAKPAEVAHRYIEITGFDEESSLALCSVSSYGEAGQLLERIDRVPLV